MFRLVLDTVDRKLFAHITHPNHCLNHLLPPTAHRSHTASEKDNMVISYLTLNIISIKTVSPIAVSLTLGDYCFFYTIYHTQAYTLPLPLNPINYFSIGIFIPIHHSVVCELCVLMCCVYYSHNITMTLICFQLNVLLTLCMLIYVSFAWTVCSHFMLGRTL